MGYYTFYLGGIHTIADFGRPKGAVLLGTPYGSVGFAVFIFIVLGCLALLLAEIFQEAVVIKNENDMTI
ncbi:MAG: DUF2975 domain-containing protein [Dethiobacter sp.]|nr:DUF2975 domain-containing protein [Dethiobacter sp.]